MLITLLIGSALANPLSDDTLSLELSTSGLHQDALLSAGASLQTDRAPYLSIEGRSLLTGAWMGRGTIGVDVLPRWQRLDVNLGLTLATAGQWRDDSVHPLPGLGAEAGVQLNLGRLHGSLRTVVPIGPDFVCEVVREQRARVGFDLGDRVQLYGEGLLLDRALGQGDSAVTQAYGLGARLTF